MLINTQVIEVNTRTRFMNYSTAVDLTDKTNVFVILNSDNGTQIRANIEYSTDGITWVLFGDFFDIVLIPNMNKVFEVSNENVIKMPFIRIAFNIKDTVLQNTSITMNVYSANEPPTEVYIDGSSFAHITTNTTTLVKTGAGTFHSLLINTSALMGNTATIYDNTSGSGTVIAIVNTARSAPLLIYNVAFSVGLTVVTAGDLPAADLTVTYR